MKGREGRGGEGGGRREWRREEERRDGRGGEGRERGKDGWRVRGVQQYTA